MNNKKIGEFLASLRKVKGLTQQQFADIFYISNKTVSKWECGEALPDITSLPAIAEFYEVTVDEILAGERKSHGKAISIETEARNNASQNRYICNTIKSKYTILMFVSYVIIMLGIVLLIVLTNYSTDTLAIAVGTVFLFISIGLMAFNHSNAKNNIETVNDDTITLKTQKSINTQSCLFSIVVSTLLFFALGVIIIGGLVVPTNTIGVLQIQVAPIIMMVIFFVYFYRKMFNVNSWKKSKVFQVVERFKIISSFVTLLCIILIVAIETYIILPKETTFNLTSTNFFGLFATFNYNKSVMAYGISAFVVLALIIAQMVYCIVKNKPFLPILLIVLSCLVNFCYKNIYNIMLTISTSRDIIFYSNAYSLTIIFAVLISLASIANYILDKHLQRKIQ